MTVAGSEAYVGGRWVGREQATVSVFDRGLLFGDGVYELIPAYDGKPFLADRHIRRLERSLAEIRLPSPHSAAEWGSLIEHAAARQDFPNQKIYVQVTRGSAPRKHPFPAQSDPTVIVFVDPFDPPTDEQAAAGAAAITLPDVRWHRGDIKATSLLAAVLASDAAAQAGAAEAILLRDGYLTEGASSNVLLIKDGELLLPTQSSDILSGITQELVLVLAKEAGVPVAERQIAAAELAEADEIWITSSSREIGAIVSVDGRQVGSGRAGPVHARLRELYRARIRQLQTSS